ncbi:MAG: hypothetical protein PHR16_13080 [Methylovulum sp.]|nr:hypothetical protein [Methylovulum sp.]
METIYLFCMLLLLVCSNVVLSETFNNLEVSEDAKQLIIKDNNDVKIIPPLLLNQVGFSQPLIAADNTAVGWLETYPDCCASYPIALTLAVLQVGKSVLRFSGYGGAIFAWCFLGDGAEIAFYQSGLPENTLRHYERYRLADGKLLAVYDEQKNVQEQPLPTWTYCLE